MVSGISGCGPGSFLAPAAPTRPILQGLCPFDPGHPFWGLPPPDPHYRPLRGLVLKRRTGWNAWAGAPQPCRNARFTTPNAPAVTTAAATHPGRIARRSPLAA
ncbi:hypothetical protein SAMN04487981_10221, partial [Streptomyces sp. cf386]